jgi:late competence protein required for DNA uptake (superfamily II DNA/RNA helicase)
MSLRYKKGFLSKQKNIPINFVTIPSRFGDEPLYAHRRCFLKYKKSKIKERKIKLKGGFTGPIPTINGEIEEY